MLKKLVSEVLKVDVASCDIYPDTQADFLGVPGFISMTLTNGKGKAINVSDFAFKCKEWLYKNYDSCIYIDRYDDGIESYIISSKQVFPDESSLKYDKINKIEPICIILICLKFLSED